MDIVTAGRACVRRWYLFIPIIIIGVLASMHVANATKPTFEATGEFIVLQGAVRPVTAPASKAPVPRVTVTRGKTTSTPSPTPTATPTPAPTSTVVNPYSGSSDLLRAAVLTQLNSPVFQQKFADAGLKGSFSVAIAKKQPLFDVTADARHRNQAVTLVNAVLTAADAQVREVQTSAGAPDSGLFGAQVLTQATNASDVTSGKSKRLVSGIVVTVAAALALAIALDSSVIALRRRRAAAGAGSAMSTVEPGAPSNTTVVPASASADAIPFAEPADGVASGGPRTDDSGRPRGRLSRPRKV